MKTILIAGYKNRELGIWDDKHAGIRVIKFAIERKLRALLDDGLEWVVIGGQPGTEWWAAEVVFDLQEEFPDLKLGVLMPFLEQEKNWKEDRQEQYQAMIDRADFADAVSKKPYSGPWQFKARDDFALAHTDALLLLYDEEREGSPKFLKAAADRLAEKQFYPIMLITMYDLEEAAAEIAEKERPDWQ